MNVHDRLALRDTAVAPATFDPAGAAEVDWYDASAFGGGAPVRRAASLLPSYAQTVRPGDVLIDLRNDGPRRAWVVGPAGARPQAASSDWLVLRSTAWDPAYARHVLVSEAFRREYPAAVGPPAGRPRDAASALGAASLRLPALEVQARLAGILDRADGLRVQRQLVAARMQSLGAALFGEQFGPVVEANHPAMPLADILIEPCRRGVDLPLDPHGRFPVIRVQDLRDGDVSLAGARGISTSDATLARAALMDGDLLLARLSGRAEVRAAVARPGEGVWFGHASVLRLRLDPRRACPEYLCAWLLSPPGQARLAAAWVGAGVRTPVEARLAALAVPVPALEAQQRYARCMGAAQRLAGRVLASAERLDALLGSLRDLAHRGELALA